MENIVIRQIVIADIEHAPNVVELLDEYATECGNPDAGRVVAQWPLYHAIEDSGAMRSIGIFDEDTLIGFANVIVSVLPHYGKSVATTESFFVSAAYRKTGAGLKLLKAVEEQAVERGAIGLLVSAPAGGRFADVLPGFGYKHSNTVFFKVMP